MNREKWWGSWDRNYKFPKFSFHESARVQTEPYLQMASYYSCDYKVVKSVRARHKTIGFAKKLSKNVVNGE